MTTHEPFRYLDLEDAFVIANELFAPDLPLIRDAGLLDSAIHRPRSSYFGSDAYPTLALKAAALLDSLCRDHALIDGNKRLALALAYAFLRMNGHTIQAEPDDLYDLVYAVASVHLEVEKIAEVLDPWIVVVDGSPRTGTALKS